MCTTRGILLIENSTLITRYLSHFGYHFSSQQFMMSIRQPTWSAQKMETKVNSSTFLKHLFANFVHTLHREIVLCSKFTTSPDVYENSAQTHGALSLPSKTCDFENVKKSFWGNYYYYEVYKKLSLFENYDTRDWLVVVHECLFKLSLLLTVPPAPWNCDLHVTVS